MKQNINMLMEGEIPTQKTHTVFPTCDTCVSVGRRIKPLTFFK